jgi:SAM-dependent methyltransferase
MRILDLGCGSGDTSLLIAKMVGPSGLVVGVDRSAAAIDEAEKRATIAGVAIGRGSSGRIPAPSFPMNDWTLSLFACPSYAKVNAPLSRGSPPVSVPAVWSCWCPGKPAAK